jgi:predicted O-methyltransferase YrrM
MDPERRQLAEAARGFMPPDEGLALFEAGQAAQPGAWLEIGSYCGKSTVYIGTAAAARGAILFALDHHRGSEENQPGWEWHEPDLVDPRTGLIDTLPHFRQTIHEAGLDASVVALVGESVPIATVWSTELTFLFIDGGHGSEPAHADYEGWVPHLAVGATLAIHDVFPDPAAGGRPPFEIYSRAMGSDAFEETAAVGSLRVLQRVAPGI